MENQDAYVIQDPQEIPLDFDHYKTLTAALADAIQRCMVWREQESGTPYTGKDLYEFAQRHDKQFVMGEDEFYMVTFEGAIGLSPGLEWLTKWVFVPMEPGEEQERLLEQMKEKLEEHERQESMSQTVSTPQPQSPLPPPPPMSPMPLRFCTNCGVKLRPGLRFCTNCGKRLIP